MNKVLKPRGHAPDHETSTSRKNTKHAKKTIRLSCVKVNLLTNVII